VESRPSDGARLIAFPLTGREPWATKRQVAEHFQVSDKTVERWVAGGMPCIRGRGRTLRFQIRACEDWLRAAS
jgi:phage terminase Nu1 subunit (DNA packaging protein)